MPTASGESCYYHHNKNTKEIGPCRKTVISLPLLGAQILRDNMKKRRKKKSVKALENKIRR